MAAWMGERVNDGRTSGAMMWGTPSAFDNACHNWSISNADSLGGTNAASWCDGMVAWMQQHAGANWGSWMMSGGMMGA